jgi:glycosyltransferase involved in cell wall biosynthesis
MEAGAALTFDLVVATVGRRQELDAMLTSLDNQSHRAFRVIVVDQNEDDRVTETLRQHPRIEATHLRSAVGLSRARNAALPLLHAAVVAFPDDDCIYPDGLLARAATLLGGQPELDGVSGRLADPRGRSAGRWPDESCPIGLDTVWNRATSATVFLRRELVERVGPFDESLGLGSGTASQSGEEIDWIVRALRLGARLSYDPALVVLHPVATLSEAEEERLARRDGASVGYILARHRYPLRVTTRMLVRAAGGVLVSLARGNPRRARYHWAVLGGRMAGYRAGRHTRAAEPDQPPSN